ncbi:TetR/AcrR family transcriptional regulator [Sphingobium phenoxybenzoativorans]|uniref:TetR/AcrR family transcriptional regulator n=1 Tax=Sphingobium phenoxybenzoativorans TaxID=1592790 RepID=UPI000872D877|nr:TetR/AcrR family transcriptional regulator [Sphingobium phenoxybenzoativorans]
MRVSREQAALNRERVIDTGSRLFREKGLDGIGIADLMKASGMTHGGFYGQFESKDALAAECVTRSFGRSVERWRRLLDQARDGHDADPLRTIVEDYLSVRHLNGPETGCAFTTLAADAARRGGAMAEAMSTGMDALVDILVSILPEGGRADALAILAQMSGAMTLARATADPALAEEILAAARKAILTPR